MQQVGKQRLELEQEIEKAKTEENYIRDRLALSLKVIFLFCGLWPAGETAAVEEGQSAQGSGRVPRKFSLLGHDPGIAEPHWDLRFRGIQASGLSRADSCSSLPLKLHWVLRAVWPG